MANSVEKVAKSLQKLMDDKNDKRPKPYDTEGTVTRVEGKTAWVKIDGSEVSETPVELSIDAKYNDRVKVRVSGGRAWLTGNNTMPPTGDTTKVKQAYNLASKTAKTVKKIEERLDNLPEGGGGNIVDMWIEYNFSTSNSQFIQATGYDWSTDIPEYVQGLFYWKRTVLKYDDGTIEELDPVFAQETQVLSEVETAQTSTNNHFWSDGTGAYVTSTNHTSGESTPAWQTGAATRVTASGILQYLTGKLMTSWTNSGMAFYDPSAAGSTPVPLAIYGSAGADIYANGSVAASFKSNGISFDPSIPFTIGNTSGSYIRWVYENGVWKIKIVADEILMGGVPPLTEDEAGKWYSGTAITGNSTTAQTFPSSGITYAHVGDMYLNTSTSNTYRCTVEGAPSAAKWVYVNNIKGGKGDEGDPGKGISTILPISTSGVNKTYRIYYTDGTTQDYVVKDGTDVTSQYVSYETVISKSGVTVHQSGNIYNCALLNATGLDIIRDYGSGSSHIPRSVAFFGDTARIGAAVSDKAYITMNPSINTGFGGIEFYYDNVKRGQLVGGVRTGYYSRYLEMDLNTSSSVTGICRVQVAETQSGETYVNIDGDHIWINGDLSITPHDTYGGVGTIKNKSQTSSRGSGTTLANLDNAYVDLEPGVWGIQLQVSCDLGSANKVLQFQLRNSTADTNYGSTTVTMHSSVSSQQLSGQCILFVRVDDVSLLGYERFYCRCFQNSGSSKNVSAIFRAVRLA